MKVFTTEIRAIDPICGEMKTWAGPNIRAISYSDAEDYLQRHGLGYCRVSGQLIAEIPCKEGSYEPDFSKQINYDNYLN